MTARASLPQHIEARGGDAAFHEDRGRSGSRRGRSAQRDCLGAGSYPADQHGNDGTNGHGASVRTDQHGNDGATGHASHHDDQHGNDGTNGHGRDAFVHDDQPSSDGTNGHGRHPASVHGG